MIYDSLDFILAKNVHLIKSEYASYDCHFWNKYPCKILLEEVDPHGATQYCKYKAKMA